MKRYVFVVLVALMASPASAQQAAPTDKFSITMAAPSLAAANGYRYDLELDAVILPAPLVMTCTGTTSPFTCSAPIPAITPTTHTVRVRAVDTSGTPILGPFSAPLTFTMRATPAQPGTLTIIPGGL